MLILSPRLEGVPETMASRILMFMLSFEVLATSEPTILCASAAGPGSFERR